MNKYCGNHPPVLWLGPSWPHRSVGSRSHPALGPQGGMAQDGVVTQYATVRSNLRVCVAPQMPG